MRRLGRRVVVAGRVIEPASNRAFLAYARAVVAYGGGDPADDGFQEATVTLARWLKSGRRATR